MNCKTIGALLASAAALLVTAPAHAATPKGDDYWFAPGATLTIVDDEWGSDEVQTFDLSNVYVGRLLGTDNKVQAGWFKISRCAGGEVRVEITAQVTRYHSYSSDVRYYVSLYEGASCSNSDLDGSWAPFVPSSLENPEKLRVDNTEEGGDYATMSLKMKKAPVY